MALEWVGQAGSDVGLLREINEDAAFAGHRLFVVADGMGGHAAGEVASAATVAAIAPLDDDESVTDPGEALRKAVADASNVLRDMVAADHDLQGMGTTMTAAIADGDKLVVGHVGDSRGYLYRHGELLQLTRDHTLVQQFVDDGRIAPADAATHPQRNVLTRAIDGRDVQPDITVLDVEAGDRLLLCSDGLPNVVSDETISTVLAEGTPQDAVDKLIDLALRGGAPDNVTCVVADAVEVVLPTTRTEATPAAASTPAALQPTKASVGAARRRRQPTTRTLLVAAAVVGLLLGAGLIGRAYVRSQYYVGVSGEHVAVFRGVEGDLAGLDLSSLVSDSGVAVSALPPLAQARVRSGIAAEDRADAEAIVDRLVADAQPSASPSPSPSGSTSPSASPTAGS